MTDAAVSLFRNYALVRDRLCNARFCNEIISQFNKVMMIISPPRQSDVLLVAAFDRIAVNLSCGDLLVPDIREGKMQNECKVDDNDVVYKDVVIIGKYEVPPVYALFRCKDKFLVNYLSFS